MATNTTNPFDSKEFISAVLGDELEDSSLLRSAQLVGLMQAWDTQEGLEIAERKFYDNRLTVARHYAKIIDVVSPGRYDLDSAVTFLDDYVGRRHGLEENVLKKKQGIPVTRRKPIKKRGVDAGSIDSIVADVDTHINEQPEISTQSTSPSSENITYSAGMPIQPILSDETILEEFSLDEYISALGESGEVSSRDLKLLMVVSDLQHDLGVCEKKFYDLRVGNAKHFRLKDEFVGRLDGRSLLFNPTEVKRFFDDYDSIRENMRQHVDPETTKHNLYQILGSLKSENRKKREETIQKPAFKNIDKVEQKPKGVSPTKRLELIRKAAQRANKDAAVSHSLRDQGLDSHELYDMLSFGYKGRKAALALNSSHSVYLDCNLFKRDGNSEKVRLYYSPSLLQSVHGVSQLLRHSLGEDAKDFMLYYAAELAEIGALPTAWTLTRTVSGRGVAEYIHRTMDPVHGAKFVQETLDQLTEKIRTAQIKSKSTPISIDAPKEIDMGINPSDINANPEDIITVLKRTNELVGKRAIRRVLNSYIVNSGRNGAESPMNLIRALGKQSVNCLADLLVESENTRDGVRMNKKERGMVHLGTALNYLYDLVDQQFEFNADGIQSTIEHYYEGAGVVIGKERIKSIMLRSGPVYVPKVNLFATDEESVYGVPDIFEVQTEMRFSIDSVIDVIENRLGDVRSGEVKGAKAKTLFEDICSYYTSRPIPQSVVETGLKAIAEDPKDYADELLSVPAIKLVAELAVLKYGWVDDESRVPDFEKVIEWYKKTDNILDVTGLVSGGQKTKYDYHQMIFDKKFLSQVLKKCGFNNIHEWDWRKTEHSEYDDYSQSYLPHMEKESGMLMSLNLEATKNSKPTTEKLNLGKSPWRIN